MEYVSVVLPTYNRAGQLKAAIESVLNQTYPYLELVIVDDGSTDNTEDVVGTFSDERIRYYKLEQNCGQSKARNYGMRWAKYEYLAFEDSDDLWVIDKLEKQMAIMTSASTDVGLVYHKLRYDFGDGRSCIMPNEQVKLAKKSGDIYAQLLWDNLVDMPTMLIRKSCLDKVGYLDEEMNCLEDYDFALRIAREFRVEFIDEILLNSSFSTTGVSGQSYKYIVASCVLVQKYKMDYIQTGTLNHRLEIILRDAKELGILQEATRLLEMILSV